MLRKTWINILEKEVAQLGGITNLNGIHELYIKQLAEERMARSPALADLLEREIDAYSKGIAHSLKLHKGILR